MDDSYDSTEDIEDLNGEQRCPKCNFRMPNDVCPACGITKEQIEKDEDEVYDRRERR
jgi:rubrerythrin